MSCFSSRWNLGGQYRVFSILFSQILTTRQATIHQKYLSTHEPANRTHANLSSLRYLILKKLNLLETRRRTNTQNPLSIYKYITIRKQSLQQLQYRVVAIVNLVSPMYLPLTKAFFMQRIARQPMNRKPYEIN